MRGDESHPFFLSVPKLEGDTNKTCSERDGCEQTAGLEGTAPGDCSWLCQRLLSTSCALMVLKHYVNGVRRTVLPMWIIRSSLEEYVQHPGCPEFYYKTKKPHLRKLFHACGNWKDRTDKEQKVLNEK